MASVDTGNQDRDAAVRDREWLAIAQFPESRFETREITAVGENRYEVAATLGIRDVTKPVTLPFTLSIDGADAHAVGELTIDRTDFGIGQGQWAAGDMVGRDVVIHFDLSARRKP